MEQLKYRIWSRSNRNKRSFDAFQLLVLPGLKAISYEDEFSTRGPVTRLLSNTVPSDTLSLISRTKWRIMEKKNEMFGTRSLKLPQRNIYNVQSNLVQRYWLD